MDNEIKLYIELQKIKYEKLQQTYIEYKNLCAEIFDFCCSISDEQKNHRSTNLNMVIGNPSYEQFQDKANSLNNRRNKIESLFTNLILKS